MQDTMLLHGLHRAADDVLFHQFHYQLKGQLNEPAFEASWREIVARHPAFRTSFAWEGMTQAVQVVHERVDLPFLRQDWQALQASA